MWRSEQGNHHHGSTNNRVASSSSSSSSSRSSPSSTSSTLLPQAPKRRTMEEVWKDIGLRRLHHRERLLTPLNHHQHHSPTASPSFRAMILQDFLAGPLNRPHAAAKNLPLLPSTMPPTALSLSPRLEIQLRGSDAHGNSNSSSNGCRASFIPPAFSDNMVRPPSPIGLFSFCSKEAMSEGPAACGHLQHKRMIKNRESAARSRARKQASPPILLSAYINELELEVARLLEEQSRLQKELEEVIHRYPYIVPKRFRSVIILVWREYATFGNDCEAFQKKHTPEELNGTILRKENNIAPHAGYSGDPRDTHVAPLSVSVPCPPSSAQNSMMLYQRPENVYSVCIAAFVNSVNIYIRMGMIKESVMVRDDDSYTADGSGLGFGEAVPVLAARRGTTVRCLERSHDSAWTDGTSPLSGVWLRGPSSPNVGPTFVLGFPSMGYFHRGETMDVVRGFAGPQHMWGTSNHSLYSFTPLRHGAGSLRTFSVSLTLPTTKVGRETSAILDSTDLKGDPSYRNYVSTVESFQ
ncbi:hypothetical protein MUK42_21532 [Musa troglodytarum]|uniref:BZIP domain-containing protein n=1 Tax=Musa troglodytarum TaxID=320322 RepID=A0A9E7G2W9_9LILI|nr:hypothetical protein MUK42_21532 [Musa troglodytarum]